MWNIFLVRIIFILSSIIWNVSSRKISCCLNPGLANNTEFSPNIVHIASEGQNDVIHYIWSTFDLPSVIVARTDVNTEVLINATKLISFERDAVLFKNGNPLETVGLTFKKLWQLNYTKDTSEIADIDSIEDLNLETFVWSDVNETLKCDESFASVALSAQNDDLLFSKNGTFKILFSVSADQKISDEYPHLVFTGNSTLLKIVLDNFHSSYARVRYGVELSIFSSVMKDCGQKEWEVLNKHSINDELSPGVFSDIELLAPCSKDQDSSFIAWRPVAYIGQIPSVANSSDVTMMENPSHVPEISTLSLAELFFLGKSNVSAFNLTFGTQGDGFYTATQFTTWSLMLGTGQMVGIPISSSVIIFTSVGLGLILIFMLSGIIFILFKKCTKRDDDLLLNS